MFENVFRGERGGGQAGQSKRFEQADTLSGFDTHIQ